ncbi:MAG: DUF2939 domain-containing protein [Gammaproteobacteria bacterium]
MRLSPRGWIALSLAVLLALGAWVASGPWRTVHGIREAVVAQDARALSRHVDFPALRASLKAQLNDQLVRQAGIDAQSGLFGALMLRVAGGLVDAAVETMVTPLGLGALMEGRKVWNNVLREGVGAPPRPATEPLAGPEYRIESLSRVTATVPDEQGRPLVFVLTRQGLRWRLSDVRLPLRPTADGNGNGS